MPAPNQVWCGDITYIWAQGKWHYLAVVLDLCTRRIVGWALSEKPDAELVIKAAGYGLRASRQAFGSAIPLGPGIAICKPTLSPAIVAIPHASEHESTRKLLGFSVHYAQERQLNLTHAGIG